MASALKKMAPIETIRIGGAGHKITKIAFGETEAYVSPDPGLGFWDICGPEVILRAVGGVATDNSGDLLVYDQQKHGGNRLPAIVIGKSKNIHDLILKRLNNV
jgi:3'-phosphoadenosine 5'-phosphosulfate (PAPS) 3'-phosphatase